MVISEDAIFSMAYRGSDGDIYDFFNISDEGIGVLEGSAADIYTVEDAVDKLLEHIDWINDKLSETYNGYRHVGMLQLEHRDTDYSGVYEKINEDISYYMTAKECLIDDITRLTGHQVPW